MGVGKTSIGYLLSQKLGVDFIDLDAEIVAREDKSINQIFQQNGELYFRKIESIELENQLNKNINNNYVIATGGGTPCFFENAKSMNEAALTIFIDTQLATLVDRLKNDTTRPLLQDKELNTNLSKLLSERKPFYESANYTIKNDTLCIEETVDKILEIIKI